MTPANPGKKPGPPSAADRAQSDPQGPDSLAILATKVMQNPEGFRPLVDVMRVPITGDGRNAVFVAQMPRDEIHNAAPWLARNVGAGSFRLDVKDPHNGFAGSAIVLVGVDNRPEELRRTQATTSPATPPPPPAPASPDNTAVLVALIQSQSSMFTAMLSQPREDPLDRIIKMQQAGLLPTATQAKPAVDTTAILRAGAEWGEKLAKVGGFSKFLDEHGDKIADGALGLVGAIADAAKKAPQTVTVAPAPAPVEPPAQPEPQPQEVPLPLWPAPLEGEVVTTPAPASPAPNAVDAEVSPAPPVFEGT